MPDLIDFASTSPTPGSLDVPWIHGARTDPPLQVHHYDEHTVVLRQSKRVHYEAPFIFLLFGNDRALLLDTGATADPARFPLRSTVDSLVAAWLERHPRERYGLLVAHTHGHGDHVAADKQFTDRPHTTIVAREGDAVRSFFGFDDRWPDQTVTLDLGGRVLDVIGSPGHHEAAITFYDRWTGVLLTGDTVLPGRLYAPDYPAFLATLDRLVDFAATRPVTHVLGCHIEMTDRPGHDYPLGARYQPAEHRLALTAADLRAIRDAAASVAARRGVHRFNDVIIYHTPGRRDALALTARGVVNRLRERVTR